MAREDEVEEFKVTEVKHATDRALLVELDDGRELWCPRSVVHADSEVYEAGHSGTLIVYEWFAVKNGWV